MPVTGATKEDRDERISPRRMWRRLRLWQFAPCRTTAPAHPVTPEPSMTTGAPPAAIGDRGARTGAGLILGLAPASALVVTIFIANGSPEFVGVVKPAARAGLVAATSLLLGVNMVTALADVGAFTATISVRLRRAAVSSAVVAAACAGALLLSSVAEADPTGLSLDAVARFVGAFTVGKALAAATALSGVYLVVEAVRGPRAVAPPGALGVMIALGAMIPVSLSGHAAHASYQWADLMVVGMLLHVFAAMSWVGGLGALAIAGRVDVDFLRRMLPAFSWVAAASCSVVLATGVLDGVVVLASQPAGFLSSLGGTYGLLLLAKFILLIVLLGLGARMRFSVVASIQQGLHPRAGRWMMTELALMAVVFGLAATLSINPPGA